MEGYEELIKTIDINDVRTTIKNFSSQIKEGTVIAKDIGIIEEINKIAVQATGSNAVAGYVLKDYLHNIQMPIFILENYDTPAFIDKETLIFVISFSGNTEETLNSYKQAVKTGATVVVITSGGKLEKLCEFNRTKLIKIPEIEPIFGYGYAFFAMLKVLENSRIIHSEHDNIRALLSAVKKTNFEEMGKTLATRLLDKLPIVYASSHLESVAKKWKDNINEIAGVISFANVFPRISHTEIASYQKKLFDYYVVMLRDEGEYIKVTKGMNITKKIIKDANISVTELGITGNCYLTRLFSALLIGDWVAYYLAIMNEKNPSYSKLISEFKEAINR